jgi:hypothetical protein
MKNILNALIMIAIVAILFSCKKEQTVKEESYKPRYVRSDYYSDFEIFDTRNTSNVKSYIYEWRNEDSIFKYNRTLDTNTIDYFAYNIGNLLKNWPKSLKNPVNIGYSYNTHTLDRDVDNKTYFLTGYDEYNKESTVSSDHTGIPTVWTKKGVIDAYTYVTEKYNSDEVGRSVFFFDLEANKYLIRINNNNVEEASISDFIKIPEGNMATHNIDFTLADAVFSTGGFYSLFDTRYPGEAQFYFLDYDAMKYILVTRKINTTTTTGKQTLRTTTWQPMSKLFDVWKF